MAETTPEQDKQALDKSKRINQMKNEADKTSQLADLLARKIPGQGGMSVDDFKNKWIPNFEKGWVNFTPDQSDDDNPYEGEYSKRPKIRILNEGKNP